MDLHLNVFILSICASRKYPYQRHSTMKIPSLFVQIFFPGLWLAEKLLIILLSNERDFKTDLKLPSEGAELQ